MTIKFCLDSVFGIKDIADMIYKKGYDWTKLQSLKAERLNEEQVLITLEIFEPIMRS